MHMKRSLAALLSATMTLSSQIAVPMSASAADTSSTAAVQTAVTTTATAPKTEAATTVTVADDVEFTAVTTTLTSEDVPEITTTMTSAETSDIITTTVVSSAVSANETTAVTTPNVKYPRVELEYKAVEVTDADDDTITLEDGKKLIVSCGEEVLYKDMFKKGNKLDIKGKFAYNEKDGVYLNCNADICITPCTNTETDKELAEKIAGLPHTDLEYWGAYVMKADKDTLLLQNGMKVYVSSGKKQYTDMFKKGNNISLVGEFAYDAETDTYYTVDADIILHQYVVCYSFFSEEEFDNFVETTTYVEDVTTTTTTTTYEMEMEEIFYTQPEGKYPIHYEPRVLYNINKTFRVDKISDAIYDENGTKWIFDSREYDIYDLGKGDVITVSGTFFYGLFCDEFCCYEGGYVVNSYNDNYEQYAAIPILSEFEHRIVDKRLSSYDDLEYKIEMKDVTVLDINDREVLTVDGGYKFAFCHTSPDLEFVRVGDHIDIFGYYTYMSDEDLFCTNYRNEYPDECGRFRIISRDMKPIHEECAKQAGDDITDLIKLEDQQVIDVDGDVITLSDGTKYSFNRLASPDMDYVEKGDKIDLIGKFIYDNESKTYVGSTKASFEIKSRKVNVMPPKNIKKNIKIENKGYIIDTYKNGVMTMTDGTKFYITPERIYCKSVFEHGDEVVINGTFDYFTDKEMYISYTADIKATTEKKPSDKAGDSNVDGSTNLADSVLIMQTIANPEKYILTDQGKKNADIDGNGDGITAKDALKIQRITLNLEK